MEILKSGVIKSMATQQVSEYRIIELDAMKLEEILMLQKNVMDHMERRDLYLGITKEEFIGILNGKGVTVGAYVNNKLIGFYVVLYPDEGADRLWEDAKIPYEEMCVTAYLEGVGVHPEYRGNSLQKILAGVCLSLAMERRDIKHLCSTVSPYNLASIDHEFKYGLYIIEMKIKYGEMLRYIFYKSNMNQPPIVKNSIIEVEASRLEEIANLLKGEYVGFNLMKSGNKSFLSFGKIENEKNLRREA